MFCCSLVPTIIHARETLLHWWVAFRGVLNHVESEVCKPTLSRFFPEVDANLDRFIDASVEVVVGEDDVTNQTTGARANQPRFLPRDNLRDGRGREPLLPQYAGR